MHFKCWLWNRSMGLLFGNKFGQKKKNLPPLYIYKHYYSIKLMCWIDSIHWILEMKILYRIASNSCRQYTALAPMGFSLYCVYGTRFSIKRYNDLDLQQEKPRGVCHLAWKVKYMHVYQVWWSLPQLFGLYHFYKVFLLSNILTFDLWP
jgi:hypothetical protein